MRKSTNKTVWLAASAVALAAIVALALFLAPEPELPPAAPARPMDAVATAPEHPPATGERPTPPLAARGQLPIDWLAGGVTTPQQPRPAGKPAYRGQLVHGATLQPAAGVTLRLTHAWLDTPLPEPEENTAAARQGENPLLAWRGESEKYGSFEVPFVPRDRDLFLVIDPDGPRNEVLLLQRSDWRGETIDLGTVVLEERGAVRGRLVGQGALAGARVRALDLPLSNVWVGVEQRETALRGAAAVHPNRPWVAGGSPAEIPRWIRRRDELLPFPEDVTSGDGRFALRSVRPGTVQLVVQTEDGQDLVRDVTVEPGRTTEVELALERPVTAELLIRDINRKPVDVDVIVSLAEELSPPRSSVPPRRTDEGKIRADRAALEDGAVFVRRAAGWPWEVYRATRARNVRFVVELSELGSASIEVFGAGGAHVPDANVTLLNHDQPMGVSGTALARELQPVQVAPGLWRAEGLPSTSYRAVVRAEAHAPGLAHAAAHTQQRPPVRVDLFPTFEVTVRVLDQGLRPVAGAQVRALPHDADRRHADKGGTFWGRLVAHSVRLGATDDSGQLRVAGFWDNSFSLEATHRGGRGLARVELPQPGQTIEIRLRAPGTILGTLTDRGGPPVETLLVHARPSRQLVEEIEYNRLHEPVVVRVDAEGRFTLRDLWPGLWHIEVRRPHEPHGGPQLRRDVWVVSGATDVMQLEIGGDRKLVGDVRGRVRLDGVAASDLVVVLQRDKAQRYAALEDEVEAVRARLRHSKKPRPLDPAFYRHLFSRGAAAPFHAVERLDADGRFEFHDVPHTELRLSIRRERGGKAQDLAIRNVPADRTRRFEVDIELTTGTLRVQVLTRQGPCRHRELRAVLVSDPLLVLPVVSDGDGQIELRDVAVGEYELRLGEDADALTARCHVVAGAARWRQLVLEPPN